MAFNRGAGGGCTDWYLEDSKDAYGSKVEKSI